MAPSPRLGRRSRAQFEDSILNLGVMEGVQIGLPYALRTSSCSTTRTSSIRPPDRGGRARHWDDVIRVGQIITEKDGPLRRGHPEGGHLAGPGPDLLHGGKLLSDDGKTVAFNNDEAAEALTMWQSLHQLGLAPKITDEELSASFLAGEVAMYVSSVMKLNSIRSAANFHAGSRPEPRLRRQGKRAALRRRGDHVLLRRPGQEGRRLEIPGVRDPGRRRWPLHPDRYLCGPRAWCRGRGPAARLRPDPLRRAVGRVAGRLGGA